MSTVNENDQDNTTRIQIYLEDGQRERNTVQIKKYNTIKEIPFFIILNL